MLLITGKDGTLDLGIPCIDGAILEEFHRGGLAVGVVGYDLKAAEKQGLAHHVQVLAEGVDNPGAAFCREGGELVIILALGQGVIHRLDETVGCKEVGNGVAHRLGIRGRRSIDRHLHVTGDVDIVVAVDAEDLLHDVALACNIDHI